MKEKCQLCQSENLKLFLKRKERNLVECQDCGLVFASPFPSKEEVKKIYTEEEFTRRVPDDETKAGFGNYLKEEELTRERFKKKVALIRKYKKKGKLLDVGCATGIFLEEAKKAGFEVFGVDIMDFAVDYCRKRGLKQVFQGTLENQKFPEASFDIVCAFELLEHLFSPQTFLAEVRRVLVPDGILNICVPSSKSFIARLMGKAWFGYRQYQHLFCFEPKTISYLLGKCGFEIMTMENPGLFWALIEPSTERIGYYYSERLGKIAQILGKILGLLGVRKVPFPFGSIFLVAKKR